MAVFNKSWDLTSSWEGRWSAKPERGSESEEYVYNAYWGTNYGLTGKYMKDFAGWTPQQKINFQNMNAQQAGEVWRKTRWTWMQGDRINDQETANIIFDWYVMRNQKAMYGVVKALTPSVTEKNWTKSPYVKKYLNNRVGGRSASNTDGFYGLSDAGVQALNAGNYFEKLKTLRNQISKTATNSILNRYASFAAGGSVPKNTYCSRVNCKDGGIGNVSDISPEIKIGKNTYYVTSLQDKHIHAGKDGVVIYTTDGKSKILKKGEWIGKVYSFDMQKDAKGNPFGRIILWKSTSYFPNNIYFLKNMSDDDISESLLVYNYKLKSLSNVSNPWILWAPGLFIPYSLYIAYKNAQNAQNGGGLPTKTEQDKTDADRDAAYEATKTGILDGSLDEILKKLLLPIGLGVAGLIILSNVSRR